MRSVCSSTNRESEIGKTGTQNDGGDSEGQKSKYKKNNVFVMNVTLNGSRNSQYVPTSKLVEILIAVLNDNDQESNFYVEFQNNASVKNFPAGFSA